MTETTIHTTIPLLTIGGYLEQKGGRLMLRMADSFEAQPDGKFKVARSWEPASGLHRLYYPVGNEPLQIETGLRARRNRIARGGRHGRPKLGNINFAPQS